MVGESSGSVGIIELYAWLYLYSRADILDFKSANTGSNNFHFGVEVKGEENLGFFITGLENPVFFVLSIWNLNGFEILFARKAGFHAFAHRSSNIIAFKLRNFVSDSSSLFFNFFFFLFIFFSNLYFDTFFEVSFNFFNLGPAFFSNFESNVEVSGILSFRAFKLGVELFHHFFTERKEYLRTVASKTEENSRSIGSTSNHVLAVVKLVYCFLMFKSLGQKFNQQFVHDWVLWFYIHICLYYYILTIDTII